MDYQKLEPKLGPEKEVRLALKIIQVGYRYRESNISRAITRLCEETTQRRSTRCIPREHRSGAQAASSTYSETNRLIFLLFITTILALQTALSTAQRSHIDIAMEEIDCEFIQPILLKNELDDIGQDLFVTACPKELHILIKSSLTKELFLHLVKNERLIGDRNFRSVHEKSDILRNNYHESFRTDTRKSSSESPKIKSQAEYSSTTHLFISPQDLGKDGDHCHYYGLTQNSTDTLSAISIVNSKLLSGLINDGAHSFYLIADLSSSSTIIMNPTAKASSRYNLSTCKHYIEPRSRPRREVGAPKRRRFPKSNPDNKVLHQPFQSNSSSLYIELLVVHDHSQYVYNKGNATLIAERTMQIVNIMNAFYRQLNIFIALVGVVLWTENDEIQLTEDGDGTLTNFLKYRYDKLLPKYRHDNAQLITSTTFNGSVVGKALKGPICTYDHSGGVNTDHSHNPAIVAVTLAHELGHNLGMEHDEDEKCKCPDEKCIMSSSSSIVHPKHWSSCSIDYLEESRKHGLLDCLVDEPVQIFGPVCGNGFVEEGEDCDIGELLPSDGTSRSRSNENRIRSSNGVSMDANMSIKNPCCDRLTCKFTTNSTCAQGPCCDLTKCSLFDNNDAKVCRPRKTECDIEEVCDGSSEHCPRDVYYHDGIECGSSVGMSDLQDSTMNSAIYNRSRAFCYQGRCASHESQCQLLWGSTGTTSKDICYEQNVHGNTSGNCGYSRLDKSFESCEMENAACGMLHCVHNQISLSDPNRKTGKLNYGFESASILTVSFFVMTNHAKIYCHGAIIDAGPGMRDPGLVPNGAACGDDKMCLNQKCISVHEVLQDNWCPSDCNGNGVCDNTGVCHCNDGTIGTSCYQFFGSNFHLSLMIYMIMFFGPVVAILVLATNHYKAQIKMWWFLQNRKIVLRNKAREPNQHRRLAYDASNCKVSISEPIPLNVPNGSNGSFIDPTGSDPWAETNCHPANGRSLGFRLEPIKCKPQRKAPPPPIPDYHSDQRVPPPDYPPPDTSAGSTVFGSHAGQSRFGASSRSDVS